MKTESDKNYNEQDSIVGKMFKRKDRDVYVTVISADTEKTKTCLVEFNDGKTMRLGMSVFRDHSLWIPFEGEMPEPLAPEAELYVSGTDTEDSSKLRKPIPLEKKKTMGRPPNPDAPWHNFRQTHKIPVHARKKPKVKARPDGFEKKVYKLADKYGLLLNQINDNVLKNRYTLHEPKYHKPLMYIYLGSNTYRVYTRPEIMKNAGIEYDEIKFVFPAVFKHKYAENSIDEIETVIKCGYDYFKANSEDKCAKREQDKIDAALKRERRLAARLEEARKARELEEAKILDEKHQRTIAFLAQKKQINEMIEN